MVRSMVQRAAVPSREVKFLPSPEVIQRRAEREDRAGEVQSSQRTKAVQEQQGYAESALLQDAYASPDGQSDITREQAGKVVAVCGRCCSLQSPGNLRREKTAREGLHGPVPRGSQHAARHGDGGPTCRDHEPALKSTPAIGLRLAFRRRNCCRRSRFFQAQYPRQSSTRARQVKSRRACQDRPAYARPELKKKLPDPIASRRTENLSRTQATAVVAARRRKCRGGLCFLRCRCRRGCRCGRRGGTTGRFAPRTRATVQQR